MDELMELKRKYTYWISRYNKGLDFFNNTLLENYEKPIEYYTDWFNDIVKRCSNLLNKIEKHLGRELTEKEKWQGFKEE